MNSHININTIYPIKKKVKDFPDDNINITPILDYIRDTSPDGYNATKNNYNSNNDFSPNK